MATDRGSHSFEDCTRQDLVSWIFDTESYDQDKKIYIDPENPGRSLSASETRTLVRRLIAGFKASGLQQGDCVCVHAYNDVGKSLALPESMLLC